MAAASVSQSTWATLRHHLHTSLRFLGTARSPAVSLTQRQLRVEPKKAFHSQQLRSLSVATSSRPGMARLCSVSVLRGAALTRPCHRCAISARALNSLHCISSRTDTVAMSCNTPPVFPLPPFPSPRSAVYRAQITTQAVSPRIEHQAYCSHIVWSLSGVAVVQRRIDPAEVKPPHGAQAPQSAVVQGSTGRPQQNVSGLAPVTQLRHSVLRCT